MCLPKDTKALASLIKKLDLPFNLLDVVTEDNSKVKKTVFNGMREN
jgi:UDP-glucose 6-dehydrogenase